MERKKESAQSIQRNELIMGGASFAPYVHTPIEDMLKKLAETAMQKSQSRGEKHAYPKIQDIGFYNKNTDCNCCTDICSGYHATRKPSLYIQNIITKFIREVNGNGKTRGNGNDKN